MPVCLPSVSSIHRRYRMHDIASVWLKEILVYWVSVLGNFLISPFSVSFPFFASSFCLFSCAKLHAFYKTPFLPLVGYINDWSLYAQSDTFSKKCDRIQILIIFKACSYCSSKTVYFKLGKVCIIMPLIHNRHFKYHFKSRWVKIMVNAN